MSGKPVDDRQYAIRLYKGGATMENVAGMLGVAPARVLGWLIEAGVPRRSRGRPRPASGNTGAGDPS